MIYVLSDIHGNLRRFNSIMEQINLKESDTLYILGDAIDRHPYGIKILRRIMKMPNAKMLLGNHEYIMLKAIGDSEINLIALALWYQNRGKCTHDYLKHIRKDLRQGMIDSLGDRITKIQFKNAVATEKLVELLANYYDRSDKDFDDLSRSAVENVRCIHGTWRDV